MTIMIFQGREFISCHQWLCNPKHNYFQFAAKLRSYGITLSVCLSVFLCVCRQVAKILICSLCSELLTLCVSFFPLSHKELCTYSIWHFYSTYWNYQTEMDKVPGEYVHNSGNHFHLTLLKDLGSDTEKQTMNTSVCG